MGRAASGSSWATTAQASFRSLARERAIPVESAAFTPAEVVAHAESNYDRLCAAHTRHVKWKNMLKRAILQGIGFSRPDGSINPAVGGKYMLCPGRRDVKFNSCFAGERKRKLPRQGEDEELGDGDSEIEESRQVEVRSTRRRPNSACQSSCAPGAVYKNNKNVATPIVPRRKRPHVVKSLSNPSHKYNSTDSDKVCVRRVTMDSAEFAARLRDVEEQLVPKDAIPREWLSPPGGRVGMSEFDRDGGLGKVAAADVLSGCSTACSLRGFKGWRSARGTHGVVAGDWYFETRVLPYEGDGAVRIGWTTRRAHTGMPVGFGEHGHGLRDRNGDYVHMSVLREYGEPFSSGDVIGCRIHLGHVPEIVQVQIREADVRWLDFKFAHKLQGCPPPNCTEMLQDGYIEWFKNGETMGVPQQFFVGDGASECTGGDSAGAAVSPGKQKQRPGLLPGTWFPTVSLFRNAAVSVRFEDFEFPPPVECPSWSTVEVRPVKTNQTQCDSMPARSTPECDLENSVGTSATGVTGPPSPLEAEFRTEPAKVCLVPQSMLPRECDVGGSDVREFDADSPVG